MKAVLLYQERLHHFFLCRSSGVPSVRVGPGCVKYLSTRRIVLIVVFLFTIIYRKYLPYPLTIETSAIISILFFNEFLYASAGLTIDKRAPGVIPGKIMRARLY